MPHAPGPAGSGAAGSGAAGSGAAESGAAESGDPRTWHVPAADGPVRVLLRLPGSKSITNRALVIAALADGPTVITEPLRARDTLLMAAALRALGAVVEDRPARQPDGGTGEGENRDEDWDEDWVVTPATLDRGARIEVGNAGTVMRFVPPVAPLARGEVAFHGDPRASHRPVGPLIGALRALGAGVDDGGRGAIPFTVRGTGGLAGGDVRMDASASSQLVSGLLLAGSRYDRGVEVRHQGPPVPSAPHIAMTVAMLRAAGARVEADAATTGSRPGAWRISPGPLCPGRIEVEPDLVNSAPFLAAALVTAGTVTVAGWPVLTSQPAGAIVDLLTRMGACCEQTADGLAVTGAGVINGIEADLRDCGELTPVLTATAALAGSPSVFTGIGHLRAHETDRLAALATEINKLGGDVRQQPDGLEVRPRPLLADRTGDAWCSYDDHRMVMAAAVLGLAVPGMTVENAATVGKTFPAFPRLWERMLARTREHGDVVTERSP